MHVRQLTTNLGCCGEHSKSDARTKSRIFGNILWTSNSWSVLGVTKKYLRRKRAATTGAIEVPTMTTAKAGAMAMTKMKTGMQDLTRKV